MKRFIKRSFFTLFAVAGLIVSCQDEETTEDSAGALSPNSALTQMLSTAAANPTNVNTAIDSIGCFNIKLPVEVVANGQNVLVQTEADIATVAAIFNAGAQSTNSLEYVFPITVVFPDYSQQTVGSQAQFNQLVAACSSWSALINNGCVALNYPVTVYSYSSSFQVQNTYTIDNNQEFFAYLTGIDSNEYYTVGYPISFIANGQTITVNSNAEFESAAQAALTACGIEGPGNPGGCNNPGILTDDLVLYMTFHHSVADLKGSTVIAPADTLFVADRNGHEGCALAFNGSQQLQITTTPQNTIVAGDVFSVSLWFKMQNTNPSDYEHLFRKGVQGEAGFNVSVYDGNTPLFGVPSAQVWDNNWNADINLWQDTLNWHHLVITFDANNTARLYRDGVLQNTEVFNATLGATALDYYIGQNFTGFLDDLRVYKKVLSDTEVQTLFELEGDCNTCLE